MSEDLAAYIAEQLKDKNPFYQWKVRVDGQKNIVELLVVITEKVDSGVQVQDIVGQNNDSGLIRFENMLCFYDPNISHVEPKTYLTAIAFDQKVGLDKGIVDGVIKQLELVLSSGRRNLHSFLEDPTQDEFSLTWDQDSFEQNLVTSKNIGRYNTEKLKIKLEEQPSIVDQFIGDDEYDGVERI